MKRAAWMFVVALSGCARGAATAGSANLAATVETELEKIATEHTGANVLWPGFDPLKIPLAIFDGKETTIFRHPSPPPGFTPVTGSSPARVVRDGRLEAITANSSASIGGVSTATLLIDRPQASRSQKTLAEIAVHESFHVHQRAHHPSWMGNETDLFIYPVNSTKLLALRRLESGAFGKALTAKNKNETACWARRAVTYRNERYAGMDSAFTNYERGTELNEGLAAYVELLAAKRNTISFPANEFGAAEVRQRAYVSGPAIAFLLDQFSTGWRSVFENGQGKSLDGALGAALGTGETCSFSPTEVADANERAVADVATLEKNLAARFSAFEAKQGWKIVVEVKSGEQLWPQGFDPLNVQRVAPSKILHTRFVRLGNGAGTLEVLNLESLTEGAGSHPLFNGIRRIELTGLPKPTVADADGKVSINTPGFTLEFKGATVTQTGEVVTVRLGQ